MIDIIIGISAFLMIVSAIFFLAGVQRSIRNREESHRTASTNAARLLQLHTERAERMRELQNHDSEMARFLSAQSFARESDKEPKQSEKKVTEKKVKEEIIVPAEIKGTIDQLEL